MAEQLIKKDCALGDYENIYPITTLESIIAGDGTPLTKILNSYNHIFVPFKNNARRDTRLQIPHSFRRKGLWITYITCNGDPVTEWYGADATNDAAWGDGKNWVPYINDEFIKKAVHKALSWYKA